MLSEQDFQRMTQKYRRNLTKSKPLGIFCIGRLDTVDEADLCKSFRESTIKRDLQNMHTFEVERQQKHFHELSDAEKTRLGLTDDQLEDSELRPFQYIEMEHVLVPRFHGMQKVPLQQPVFLDSNEFMKLQLNF